MFTSLKTRSEEAELLDDLLCKGEEVDQNLRELETINKWLGGDYVTIEGIEKILGGKEVKDKIITIADLGCGGGDMLIKVAKWAKRKNLKVRLIGIDANPYIVNYARRNASAFKEIEFLALDIFSEEFKKLKFDIITSTLFTHHFTDQSLVQLYQQLDRQSSLGIITNDIHRHFLAYHSINLLTRLFSKSYMVKNDAGLSVKRAFRLSELKDILTKAGIDNYNISWKWAFRWQIIIKKN
ncbi:MAG TPA: methyltransferase domain-containing protein [Cytophagales bacterium]|nr:methyltransferase domain-containing protein [Cytophagales bacterium]